MNISENQFYCPFINNNVTFWARVNRAKMHPCQLCLHREDCKPIKDIESIEFGRAPVFNLFFKHRNQVIFDIFQSKSNPEVNPGISLFCTECGMEVYPKYANRRKERIYYVFDCQHCGHRFFLRKDKFQVMYVGYFYTTGEYVPPERLPEELSEHELQEHLERMKKIAESII